MSENPTIYDLPPRDAIASFTAASRSEIGNTKVQTRELRIDNTNTGIAKERIYASPIRNGTLHIEWAYPPKSDFCSVLWCPLWK